MHGFTTWFLLWKHKIQILNYFPRRTIEWNHKMGEASSGFPIQSIIACKQLKAGLTREIWNKSRHRSGVS